MLSHRGIVAATGGPSLVAASPHGSTDTFVMGNYVFDDVPVSIIGGSQETTVLGNDPD